MIKKSIVYINYSPYENSGHILDYLIENFEKVYLFTIAFHVLNRSNALNRFSIYEKGKLIKTEYLYCMKIPQSLVFFLMPVRSLINFFQIVSTIRSIKSKDKTIDIFFTVNAFIATIGRILKKLNLVKTTIFWVWDYYPIKNTSLSVKIMRLIYWQLDKFSTFSDRVIYLHQRLIDVRKNIGLTDKDKQQIVVPIGTGNILPIKAKNLENIKLGFIGVLKKSQGLDMLLDSSLILSKHFKNLSIEIIGSGPDENIFKNKVKKSSHIRYNFYGFVSEEKIKDILYNCTIGIAPYMPSYNTSSKYTDPGKLKLYTEFNLPIITTDVVEISKELAGNGCGEIIKYGDSEALAKAIKKIINNYDTYTKNVISLHGKYYYKEIYKSIFNI